MSSPTESDPIALFLERREAARQAGAGFDATVAAMATADRRGRPSLRFVLVKEVGPEGFFVYTNFESRKARDLSAQPWTALAFHWPEIGVQFRVAGPASPAPDRRSDQYFASRPRESQLGAWASPQSQPLDSRDALLARLQDVTERFESGAVQRPAFWGGYQVVPEEIEYWVNGDHRLHHRTRYTRGETGWTRQLLAP